MDLELLLGILRNALLMLGLFVIYELSYLFPAHWQRARLVATALLAAGICLVIMMNPYVMGPGMVYDTRTIVISVIALSFGPLPTAVTVVLAIAYRWWLGGIGMWMGIATILASALIGLIWRRAIFPRSLQVRWKWLNLYFMGLAVHLALLACMRLLPTQIMWTSLRQMALPVMVVYPLATVLLGMLLLHQRERTETIAQLRQSEERFQTLFNRAPMGYQSLDRAGRFLDVNQQWLEALGYKREEVIGRWFGSFMPTEDRPAFEERFARFKEQGKVRCEVRLIHRSGELVYFAIIGRIGYDENGALMQTYCILQDITEQKQVEADLLFANDHDGLTGLYNRRYLEQELAHLQAQAQYPISVIIGDLDGLRMINDAFGHTRGDQLICLTGEMLSQCARPGDVVSRVGGDEYMLLLPNTDATSAHAMMQKISEAFQTYNDRVAESALGVYISLGYGTMDSPADTYQDALRVAEDYMYQRKVLVDKSPHSSILKSITMAMQERSFETESHAERLVQITRHIGVAMGLEEQDLDHLHMLSKLHDIGKVGIADGVLNKAGPLTAEEWVEMKKHPEIGYRITSALPTLTVVAEAVLSHHERWDGGGYPRGLVAEQIPLPARILAVADAYDAMTEQRPYRAPLTHEAALAEIARCAGSQFDPEVAQVFLGLARDEKFANGF